MAGEDSFEAVLAQLRQLNNEAATAVFQRFAQRLIALARKKLAPRLLQKLDAEDVAQSAMRTVLLRIGKGQFQLGDWDSLWGLLARVTSRKCCKWVAYYGAAARNIAREKTPVIPESVGWEVIDRAPTPAEVLQLAETTQEMLRGLNELEQQIVALSLQGEEAAAISQQLGCSLSKVYRVLSFIKKRLKRMREADYA